MCEVNAAIWTAVSSPERSQASNPARSLAESYQQANLAVDSAWNPQEPWQRPRIRAAVPWLLPSLRDVVCEVESRLPLLARSGNVPEGRAPEVPSQLY